MGDLGVVYASFQATISQQTLDVDPMSFQCWATVYNAGPKHQWGNVSCLLG